jgi:hypothetical protein
LFEHIDGQADLFLQYGFQQSAFVVYENSRASQEKIDADVYDMGDPVHAFGVFSRFRQENRPAGIGFDSYLDDQYAIFYKGKYFVVLQATEATSTGLKQLAQIIESRITDAGDAPKELGYFPKKGLKPGSIEYYPEGLMGRQFLKRGFKARYTGKEQAEAKTDGDADEPDSSLFIAMFDSPGEAATALKSFKEVLSKNGKVEALAAVQPGCETVQGKDPYQGQIVLVHKGRYLVGAAGFEKEKYAEALLTELVRTIQ